MSNIEGNHRKKKDIAGQRSGRVVAIEPTDKKRRGATLWRCQCDCGKEILLEPYKITNGIVQSCGCIRTEKKIKDLTGQRFGKLTALYRTNEQKNSSYIWVCQCDCGKETKVSSNALLSGNSRSCGCKRVESIKKTMEAHGTVTDHLHLIDGTCIEKLEYKKLKKNNTSGYTGVQARGNKWVAVITFKKKAYYLGSYSELEDAIKVRRQAEERIFGEFLKWYYDSFPKKEKKQEE